MRPEKEEFYRIATSKLLRQLDGMKMTPEQRHQAKKLTLLIRNRFKDHDVKMATFGPDLGYDISAFTYDADGFCKASSFTFMTMMNPENWRLMYINETWTYGPHHFLMHIPSKQVFDLTADQYTNVGISVPYEMGYSVTLNEQESQSARRFAAALAIKNNKQND